MFARKVEGEMIHSIQFPFSKALPNKLVRLWCRLDFVVSLAIFISFRRFEVLTCILN